MVKGLKLLAVTAGLGCATAAAATLAPGVQQKLSNATFGPLSLRDAAGTTYRIDKILKFSSAEDYAVFSVLAAPSVVPLETRLRPPLNTAVFAVGNALGEGVVARDGLYTSDTPEERDGRWQWLRFSAAASPGNSGGPLIDRLGNVIGVVLRKSPNENLNFALAIGQVLDGDEQNAVFENRASYRIAVMKTADSIRMNDKIPLPQGLDEFYAAARKLAGDWMTKVHSDFMKNHADVIFPSGNSEQLLTTVYAEAFPKVIVQSESGTWALAGDAPHKAQLDKNGYLEGGTANGVFLVRLKTPDDVRAADLIADSKQFMDLLLKGYPDRRQLELPVVLPHLELLPGLPHVNVTGSELHMPAFLILDWVYRREKLGLPPKAEEALSLPCWRGHRRRAIAPCPCASA